MSDKQIQPVRRGPYQITQRTRPRSLMGQVSLVLLQPGYFFRSLPQMHETRSWLWAAVLILALLGVAAVRHQSLVETGGGNTGIPDFGGGPLPGTDLGGGEAGPTTGEFVRPGVGGEAPMDPGMGGGPSTGGDSGGSGGSITGTWTTALLTGTGALVGWFVLSILLVEVSLFNGRTPALGHNFQIAIWASMPLALMALLQLIFYAGGGGTGEAGLAGLLDEWDAYATMSPLMRDLVLSLFSKLTIFWLWSLILIYVGARGALNGKTWASGLVVVAWVALLVIAPVVTGAIKAPEVAAEVPMDMSGDLGQFDPASTSESPSINDLPPGVEDIQPAPEAFSQREGAEAEAEPEATSAIKERVPSEGPPARATAQAETAAEAESENQSEGVVTAEPTEEAE